MTSVYNCGSVTFVSIHLAVIGSFTRAGKMELEPTLPALAIHILCSCQDRKNVFTVKSGEHRRLLQTVADTLIILWEPALRALSIFITFLTYFCCYSFLIYFLDELHEELQNLITETFQKVIEKILEIFPV